MLKVCFHRDSLSVKGSSINEIALKWISILNPSKELLQSRVDRDNSENFHMTVITSSEMKGLEKTKVDLMRINLNECNDFHLWDAGVGHVRKDLCEAWFVVIISNKFKKVREELGLPWKNFHITLAFSNGDVHDEGEKSMKSIIEWNPLSNLIVILPRIIEEYRGNYHDNDVLTLVLHFIEEQVRSDSPPSSTIIEIFRSIFLNMLSFLPNHVKEMMGHYLFQHGSVIGLRILLYLCTINYIHQDQLHSSLPKQLHIQNKENFQKLQTHLI